MNTFRTIEHLASCATKAAIEPRQDPLLMGSPTGSRPCRWTSSSSARWKTGSRALAIMASTARWMSRFGLVEGLRDLFHGTRALAGLYWACSETR